MKVNDQKTKSPIRAGTDALSLLAAPVGVQILQALEEGPKELTKLRALVDSAPQSTARVYSKKLKDRGVIDRRRRQKFPSQSDYKITKAGRELLKVGRVLQDWLNMAPEGPIQLGSPKAKNTIKALVGGWSTNILRAIALRPLSLTEMSRLISTVSYPGLERRLSALRLEQLVVPYPDNNRSVPYIATEWLRRAVIPLTVAAGWERRFPADYVQPIGPLDVEAAFLLAIPLMSPPQGFSGQCRLEVEVARGDPPKCAGVQVGFEAGKLVSCTSRFEGEVQAWASGRPDAWIRRMSGTRGSLDVGGEISTAEAVLDGLAAVGRPLPAYDIRPNRSNNQPSSER